MSLDKVPLGYKSFQFLLKSNLKKGISKKLIDQRTRTSLSQKLQLLKHKKIQNFLSFKNLILNNEYSSSNKLSIFCF